MNYGVGFILRNRDTSKFRYFHASRNKPVLDEPVLVKSPAELEKLWEEVDKKDVLEWMRQH